ncbi:MAG: hypothetical protein HYU66_04290 [Armatimonadetes bacterium]|nr:hypothetical protein [Armatimonadota bacterium]
MPLRWERGRNPYRHNHYGRLQVGPYTLPTQVLQTEKNLIQLLDAGRELTLDGQRLDAHAISEASSRLREPRSQAEELLLVHPGVQDDRKRLKKLWEDLRREAALERDAALPLLCPEALFWFTPAPGVEAADLPRWEAFGLVEAGDPEDLELDLVFDV